jgi:hypothetical protein
MRKHGGAQVFRITGARKGLAEDVRGRQRRYIITMSIRTLSVILATVLWGIERHVAMVALILGGVLPYISVVIANAGRENVPSLPSAFDVTATRIALPAPSSAGAAEPGTGPQPEEVTEAEARAAGRARAAADGE